MTTEFLTLEYAKGDKLYVPVSSLHLISRYTGASPETAPLHRLGGDQWDKVKRKAAEKAHDVAAELLDIYARRAAREGVAFPAPGQEYAAFADTFAFDGAGPVARHRSMVSMNLHQATTALPALIEAALNGEEVVIGDQGIG